MTMTTVMKIAAMKMMIKTIHNNDQNDRQKSIGVGSDHSDRIGKKVIVPNHKK